MCVCVCVYIYVCVCVYIYIYNFKGNCGQRCQWVSKILSGLLVYCSSVFGPVIEMSHIGYPSVKQGAL